MQVRGEGGGEDGLAKGEEERRAELLREDDGGEAG